MKTALITGGQQGIGLGIATMLAGAGYSVAIAAETDPDSPIVQDALAILGSKARYYRHDVRDIAAIPTLLDRVEDDLGPLTTFVSNAGVGAPIRPRAGIECTTAG